MSKYIVVRFTERQAMIVLQEMERLEVEAEEANYRQLANHICNNIRKALDLRTKQYKDHKNE